jgi:hypothetical protein
MTKNEDELFNKCARIIQVCGILLFFGGIMLAFVQHSCTYLTAYNNTMMVNNNDCSYTVTEYQGVWWVPFILELFGLLFLLPPMNLVFIQLLYIIIKGK